MPNKLRGYTRAYEGNVYAYIYSEWNTLPPKEQHPSSTPYLTKGYGITKGGCYMILAIEAIREGQNLGARSAATVIISQLDKVHVRPYYL